MQRAHGSVSGQGNFALVRNLIGPIAVRRFEDRKQSCGTGSNSFRSGQIMVKPLLSLALTLSFREEINRLSLLIIPLFCKC